MALIAVTNLSIAYRTGRGLLRAVDDISFSIAQGGSVGFVGESGCGKTTLGMALMGLLPGNASVLQGEILFNGRDLARFNEEQWREVRGSEIAMIFQAAMNALNPVIRVGEQIIEAIETHSPGISRKEAEQKAQTLFDLVELPRDRLKDFPHHYSGGMKQRAVIAMALACDPALIVADEPTTALDVVVQDQILREIKAIQKRTGTSLVFISHDIAVVAQVCEDICVMYGGQIVEKGKRQEVFKSPAHPYTKILLSSYLTLDADKGITMPDIQNAPDMMDNTRGCRFAENCPLQSHACTSRSLPWVDLSETHKVRCLKDAVKGETDDGNQ